jgi:glycosyltransferase involved in cell wall biosynthesis
MTRPRRALLIQTQAENAGAQEITRILGKELTARGYEVFNLFFYRKSATFAEQPNTYFCAEQRPSSIAQFARLVWRLGRHIRDTRPDLILTFQHYGNVIAAPVARLVSPAPVIANQVSALPTMSRLVRTLDLAFGMLGLFKAVTVNSVDVQRTYAALPGPYSDRVVLVAHGFAERKPQLSRHEALAAFGLPEASVLLGCVARLHRLKGLDSAIRLLKLNPAWHLALLGQGPDRERLAGLAAQLGVSDRLHFAGEVAPDQIGNFLSCLDAFVFPTLAETFGLAAVEAAQVGIPVVANDLPVLREVLCCDGQPAALFVDASKPEEFLAATLRVLQDVKLREALQQTGRLLKSRYSVTAMVDDYEKIFERLLTPDRRDATGRAGAARLVYQETNRPRRPPA